MVVNGRYTINVCALRDIEFGEELTFDYSSVGREITRLVPRRDALTFSKFEIECEKKR